MNFNMSAQFDREYENIKIEYERGLLTPQQYNQAVRDLEREERGAAEEAAELAYRDAMEGF